MGAKTHLDAGVDSSPARRELLLSQFHQLGLLSAIEKRHEFGRDQPMSLSLPDFIKSGVLRDPSPLHWAGCSLVVLTKDERDLNYFVSGYSKIHECRTLTL